MPNNLVVFNWKESWRFRLPKSQKLLGQFGPRAIEEHFKPYIMRFGEQADIYIEESAGLSAAPAHVVNIDFKEVKHVGDAKGHTPLEVIHRKGPIITMFLRPDVSKNFGLVFKFCTNDLIRDDRVCINAAKQFNRSDWYRAPTSKRSAATYDPLRASA